ncbi:MAG: NAD(P)H-binding protein [Nitrospirota bacterium]|nr:NAD(P)H-binding protein [Nitrospirota bacterium]
MNVMRKGVLIVGCGYSGRAVALELLEAGVPVTGTVGDPAHLGAVAATGAVAERLSLPDALSGKAREAARKLISRHRAVVYAIGPEREAGERFVDHTLAFADLVSEVPGIEAFVYLSSTGVYGARNGDWVDEETPMATSPGPRGKIRIQVENGLLERCRSRGLPVRILRLTGIYGPGRHIGLRLKEGNYRVVDADPPLVVNRIHVADVAQTVVAAIERGQNGDVVVVSDGHPASLREVADYAARLMGVPPPESETLEEAWARMGEANFHLIADSKRCRNTRLIEVLGVKLRYPDYRSGLAACLSDGGLLP